MEILKIYHVITSIHAKPLLIFGTGNTLNALRALSYYYVTAIAHSSTLYRSSNTVVT